ncbi:MAG TPA: hypothetical protein VGV40_10115 [Solirubrobacteraceae bacterium]|nr:hypothetical protein [Solirubrobacteraceae bacterium]
MNPLGIEEGPRTRLERLALDAALAVEGVAGAGGDAAAAAEPGDRFGVRLRLTARLVPLLPLADAVRDAVARAAGREGLADDLGSVDVRFDAVEAPG